MESVKVTNRLTWIIFVLVILNIVAFIFLTNRLYFRLDMTADRNYSVSKPTVDLLESISPATPLTIEYYYNTRAKEVKGIAQTIQYIEDILSEYQNAGGRSVNVIINELNYNNEKDRMKIGLIEQEGIEAYSLVEREKSGAKSLMGFSGIILKYKDKKKVMPFLFSDQGFEYNLDVEISKLISLEGNKIGIIVADEQRAASQNYSILLNKLQTEFDDVKLLNVNNSIPDDVSLLIILGGKTFTEKNMYELDQFLMNGGKAFIALNGVNVSIMEQFQLMITGRPNENKLNELLAHYGIKVNHDVVGDNASYLPFLRQTKTQSIEENPYPVWPMVKTFAPDQAILSDLKQLTLFWPSSITLADDIRDRTTILFSSTINGWSMKEGFGLNIEAFEFPSQMAEGAKVLSCYFDGELTSYYKDRPAPVDIPAEVAAQKVDSGSSQLVVVANEAFLESQMIQYMYQMAQLGLAAPLQEEIFFMNSVDVLTKSSSLIEIRNKGKFARPLDKAKDDKEFTARKNSIITAATVIVPLLILLLGIVLLVLRTSTNKRLKEEFAPTRATKEGEK